MRAIPRRSKRALALLCTEVSPLNWMRIAWFATILWFEIGLFQYNLAYCSWGDKQLARAAEPPTHVLVISDPQVRGASPPNEALSLRLQRWLYHSALRKNWKYAGQLKPDAVIFLGDLLASGRKIKDDERYAQAVERLRMLFSLDHGIQAYFVPGNEDVGLNLKEDSARQHYMRHFGAANRRVSIRNHSFVFLDAPLLVEEDYHRAQLLKSYDEWHADPNGTIEFILSLKESARGHQREPVILFTHIPLNRPDIASCGPRREHGTIRKGAGPGYQNMLGKWTTHFIFENIRPSLVFSGDDRDYCDYTHMFTHVENATSVAFIREVTVKSFSPYKHISNPGFHLLSLVPPYSVAQPLLESEAYTFTDTPCFLPSQASIYTSVYIPLTILTSLVLLVVGYRQPQPRYQPLLPSVSPVIRQQSPPPHGITYLHQYQNGDASTSLLSGSDTTRSSPDSWSKGSSDALASWPSSASPGGRSWNGRGRHGRQGAPGISRWSQVSQLRRTWQILRFACVEFSLVALPSLALWTFIAWWTLR